jgi:hypothetical protein
VTWDDCAIDAAVSGRFKLRVLACKLQSQLRRSLLGRREEEERRSIAEGKRRGQRGQGKGAD